MVNAQEWLDQNYPKETRKNIESLKIINKDLKDHLDLRDFVNLESLYCSKNKLTSLDLSKNSKLAIVNIRENRISSNLDIFSHLTELTVLELDSSTKDKLQQEEKWDLLLQERGRKGKISGKWVSLIDEDTELYNDFSGSLKALNNCQKLRKLSIKNQENIKGDLRDLPTSLETFNCEDTIFQQELEPFEYDFKVYRLNQKIKELENKVEEEREIHQDAMKAIDKFYWQNPPQEDLSLQNILKEISDDYLSLNRENKQLRKEKRELEDRLKSLGKLMEVELEAKQQLEAKIEILSLEKNSKPR